MGEGFVIVSIRREKRLGEWAERKKGRGKKKWETVVRRDTNRECGKEEWEIEQGRIQEDQEHESNG